MADSIGFDFSEINKLAANLGDVARNAGPNVRSAVEVTALKVKRAWQDPLKGSNTLHALPAAVTYDIEVDNSAGGTAVAAEIGFDLSRAQGPLGGISEYGAPTIAGRGFGLAALEANQADFQNGLDIALRQAERSAGL